MPKLNRVKPRSRECNNSLMMRKFTMPRRWAHSPGAASSQYFNAAAALVDLDRSPAGSPRGDIHHLNTRVSHQKPIILWYRQPQFRIRCYFLRPAKARDFSQSLARQRKAAAHKLVVQDRVDG